MKINGEMSAYRGIYIDTTYKYVALKFFTANAIKFGMYYYLDKGHPIVFGMTN